MHAYANSAKDAAAGAATIEVAESGALDEAVSAYRNRINTLLAAGFAELRRHGYEPPDLSGVGWSADYVASCICAWLQWRIVASFAVVDQNS